MLDTTGHPGASLESNLPWKQVSAGLSAAAAADLVIDLGCFGGSAASAAVHLTSHKVEAMPLG